MSSLFGNISPIESGQVGIAFPQALTDKYRPRSLDRFIGLDKPKKLAAALARNPYACNCLFEGPSGTGKTTLALALAELIPAEIHHIPSQECNLETLERICRTCQYVPMQGCKMHLILVDEANKMSPAAQLFLHSKLDSTAKLPNTIWVFTCNETDSFLDSFLSRINHRLQFSSYGIAADAAALLRSIWNSEAPAGASEPNFARIVKESNNNIRESLCRLETELVIA